VLVTGRQEEAVVLAGLVRYSRLVLDLFHDACEGLLTEISNVLSHFLLVPHERRRPPLSAKDRPGLIRIETVLCHVEGRFDILVMHVGGPALMLVMLVRRHA